MKKQQRGFTLIELLVVIAIIGILASVVLASLNSARNKGADAAIKSGLANMRAQAELYYDTNSGYSTANLISNTVSGCTTANSIFADTVFTNAINSVQATAGAAPTCYLGDTSGQKASSWAISSPLKTSGHWCVDSSGASKQISSPITAASC